jgi:serine/threonine-protein kinase
MKRLVGITLADVLARRTGEARYTRQKLLRAFADVCLAVELAHSRGVIHRDLKPANIMLGDFGEVYVLDWGIARVVGETDPELTAPATGQQQLTQVGAILGTPGYMAPEQARGEAVDHRADLYAVGAVVYRCITGRAPFAGQDHAALLYAMVHDMPVRPSALVQIHADVERVLAIALAKRRGDRFGRMQELAEALRVAYDGRLASKVRAHADALLRSHPWREVDNAPTRQLAKS